MKELSKAVVVQSEVCSSTYNRISLTFPLGPVSLQNIGLHLNIQKDGTKDGDNGRVTVEGSFAMAMTLGLPGTFVGSFVGQGYMRVSGNPPSMKSDGTRAFAGSSTIAQAKWLVTEWLALMVKDTK